MGQLQPFAAFWQTCDYLDALREYLYSARTDHRQGQSNRIGVIKDRDSEGSCAQKSGVFASGSGNKLWLNLSLLFSAQMNSRHSRSCLRQRAVMYIGS